MRRDPAVITLSELYWPRWNQKVVAIVRQREDGVFYSPASIAARPDNPRSRIMWIRRMRGESYKSLAAAFGISNARATQIVTDYEKRLVRATAALGPVHDKAAYGLWHTFTRDEYGDEQRYGLPSQGEIMAKTRVKTRQ
jgi:hypothetical protein